VAHSYPQITE